MKIRCSNEACIHVMVMVGYKPIVGTLSMKVSHTGDLICLLERHFVGHGRSRIKLSLALDGHISSERRQI